MSGLDCIHINWDRMASIGDTIEPPETTEPPQGKSIRFTVSQVGSDETESKNAGRRASNLYDTQEGTIGRNSLGYTTLNTMEAYPNTLYYRDQDSSQVALIYLYNLLATK